MPLRFRSDIPIVPVVRLYGIIGFSTPLRPGLTLAGIARALDRAFSVANAKAVALLINSPGGSPVQSHLIFRRIRDLAEEKELPVIAFVEDVAASGGYMVACAADEIVADSELDRRLDRRGRRLLRPRQADRQASASSAGSTRPANTRRCSIHFCRRTHRRRTAEDVAARNPRRFHRARQIAPRRQADRSEESLFSGEYWVGRRAHGLGLVDGIGDLRSTLRERFRDKVRTPLITAANERLFWPPDPVWARSAGSALRTT